MLNSIGVENFRGFKNHSTLSIKPITILVGKNSSGKSSFLRLLPLLRQSAEADTNSPILWHGKYLDFGDITQVISRNSESPRLSLFFDVSLTKLRKIRLLRESTIQLSSTKAVKLKIILTNTQMVGMLDCICIETDDAKITINHQEGSKAQLRIAIGEESVEHLSLTSSASQRFIPSIEKLGGAEETGNTIIDEASESFTPRIKELSPRIQLGELEIDAVNQVKLLLAKITSSNPTKTELTECATIILHNPNIIDVESIEPYLELEKKITPESMSRTLKTLNIYRIQFQIRELIDNINTCMSTIFCNVKYIGPSRSSSERHYRFQDVQVKEIDHTGSNLAMLLNSLTLSEKNAFDLWAQDNFDFTAMIEQNGSHFSVKIKPNDDNDSYNMSDMGFGYSQVIPIILSIWVETERGDKKANNSPKIFAIEQPELHLHPALQSKLGRLFGMVVDRAIKSNFEIKLIIETHSQYIIEALGELLEERTTKLSPDDIEVAIFQNDTNKIASISVAKFDENGSLTGWPIGFFSGK